MRKKEIGEDKIWEIPAERYKTKVPHYIPLSDAMLSLIKVSRSSTMRLRFSVASWNAILGFWEEQTALDRAVLAAMKRQAKKGAGLVLCRTGRFMIYDERQRR